MKVKVSKGRYLYPDFIVIAEDKKQVIEVSPVVWHTRYGKNDNKKINYFMDKGYNYLSLSDKTMINWEDIIRNELL